jgi:hypothetical protein
MCELNVRKEHDEQSVPSHTLQDKVLTLATTAITTLFQRPISPMRNRAALYIDAAGKPVTSIPAALAESLPLPTATRGHDGPSKTS